MFDCLTANVEMVFPKATTSIKSSNNDMDDNLHPCLKGVVTPADALA